MSLFPNAPNGFPLSLVLKSLRFGLTLLAKVFLLLGQSFRVLGIDPLPAFVNGHPSLCFGVIIRAFKAISASFTIVASCGAIVGWPTVVFGDFFGRKRREIGLG